MGKTIIMKKKRKTRKKNQYRIIHIKVSTNTMTMYNKFSIHKFVKVKSNCHETIQIDEATTATAALCLQQQQQQPNSKTHIHTRVREREIYREKKTYTTLLTLFNSVHFSVAHTS